LRCFGFHDESGSRTLEMFRGHAAAHWDFARAVCESANDRFHWHQSPAWEIHPGLAGIVYGVRASRCRVYHARRKPPARVRGRGNVRG
jgi:hypothetical protein